MEGRVSRLWVGGFVQLWGEVCFNVGKCSLEFSSSNVGLVEVSFIIVIDVCFVNQWTKISIYWSANSLNVPQNFPQQMEVDHIDTWAC